MIKKSIFYIVGMFIACMGVGLVLKSNIGAGPWDAFYMGASEKIGLSIGICVIIGQMVFLLMNSLLLKNRPAFESVITIVLWGFILDFCLGILLKNVYLADLSLLSKWLFFLTGVMLIGVGIGVYLISRFPAMPYDGMMMALVKRFGLKINVSRTILEGIGLLAAYLLGGPVGMGSIIFVLFLGTFIQICNRGAEKVLLKV
ncbi:YczE/YyaS/YitT family protein [Niallia nealsonii]|uniref:Uncharacterized protein n=1 Tax=Niallia nealsonii TaxID=115979 RepID=A0A2N0YWH3_9BACI|nr:hypothetical protein [Niallia nealsonii]PKG21603.1 hypothetical protein CWS01_21535 [Niallia nealsonii]